MRKVALTGATGFIGGRLAEVLVERGAQVVCVVRRWGGASRLARLPVRMVGGDVRDPASLRAAFEGCDTVLHCAVDFRASGRAHERSSVGGTKNVLEAALGAGVSRVVHLSSAAVFGLSPRPDAQISEEASVRRTGQAYSDGKIAAERVALEFGRRHGLPITILRPTVVYGPFGSYSRMPASLARERRLVLIDGGEGVCNCLYVDNLVQAVLLAAVREEAVGQIFTISDGRPVTWREYLERHAWALGPDFASLPAMSREELRSEWRRLRRAALRRLFTTTAGNPIRLLRDPAFKQGFYSVPGMRWASGAAEAALKRLPARASARVRAAIAEAKGAGAPAPERGDAPARHLSPGEVETLSVFEHVTFSVEKARRLLGYAPSVDFTEGMTRTEAWIRWAYI
ncbi:MAG: NAD-dependent epimerase/dehydratase family protein [Gemmatimonadota bacterium]